MTITSQQIIDVSVLLGAMGAIIAVYFKLRGYLFKRLRATMRFDQLDLIAEGVNEIKEQLRFNGGSSVKDQVHRMSKMMDAEFWMRPQPAFLCQGDGTNSKVSEAYCHLVGVASIEELSSLSWRIFIHPDDLDEYDDLWERALSTGTGVVAAPRFHTMNGVDRGRWRVRICPLSPVSSVAKTRIFAGYFLPVDEKAKQIWNENHWSQ